VIRPDAIDFVHGAGGPFALKAAVCAVCVKESSSLIPGVHTPALGLPLPSVQRDFKLDKTLVVNGASASTGIMAIQVARAMGVDVIAIVGAANIPLAMRAGACAAIDRAAPSLVNQVVDAVKALEGNEFAGIFDAISVETTLATNLAVLDQLGRGHLALTHPPPQHIPQNVQAGIIFAVNNVATPCWRTYVTATLEGGQLQCLPPPLVVGNGLEWVQRGSEMSKAGVSGTKLVVELD